MGNKKSSFNFPSLAKLEAKLKSWRDCSAGAGNQTSSRTRGKQESRETKHPGLPPPTRSVPDVVHSEDRGACHSQCPYCTCPCSSAGLAQAPVTPQPFGEVGKKRTKITFKASFSHREPRHTRSRVLNYKLWILRDASQLAMTPVLLLLQTCAALIC